MSQTHQWRIQTGVIDTPAAGIVTTYANSSGILVGKDSGGNIFTVGSKFQNTVVTSAIATGGSNTLYTGKYFGVAGTMATGLANPNLWISVSVSGATYAIPAYLVS